MLTTLFHGVVARKRRKIRHTAFYAILLCKLSRTPLPGQGSNRNVIARPSPQPSSFFLPFLSPQECAKKTRYQSACATESANFMYVRSWPFEDT